MELRKLKPNHPDLAQGYMSLGSLYKDLERFDDAIVQMHKALAVYVNAFDPKHPKVAWAHEAQTMIFSNCRPQWNYQNSEEFPKRTNVNTRNNC